MSDTIKAVPAIRFKTDEISDHASKIELVKIVLCVNCQEIPYRPIYNCQNGHVVCSSCRGFNFRCGACNCVVTDTRNRVAEEIVMSFVFKCKYRSEGCMSLIASPDVFKHLTATCEYRPIPCSEALREKCKGKLILHRDFLQHLKDVHGIHKYRSADGIFKRVFHCESVTHNISWPLYCFEFDGHAFFQHIMLVNNIAYLWVSFFGIEADQKNYIATLSVKKASTKREAQHIFPVHNIRTSLATIKSSGNVLTLLREQLMSLASENVRDEADRTVHNFSWTTLIKMSKTSGENNPKGKTK